MSGERKQHDPRPDIQGPSHPMAKLTEEDVREIIKMNERYSLRAIARVKDVSYSAVWRIVNRRSWRYLWQK